MSAPTTAWCRSRSMAAARGGAASVCPGLPDYGSYGVYVQRLYAGKSDESTVYALFDNSKNGDFKPYIFKSTTRGASWTAIAGDLPANGPALAFAEDPVNPDLLFVGTEFGLFFTVDGGTKWIRLQHQPAHHPGARPGRCRSARATWCWPPSAAASTCSTTSRHSGRCRRRPSRKTATSSRPRPVTIELPETGRARGFQGEQLWMGENRPLGATVTYWVKDTPKTLKERRQEAARAAEAKKETPAYPTQAALTAEADEEAPQTFLTVTSAAGAIVRRLMVAGGPWHSSRHLGSARHRPGAAAGRASRRRGGGGGFGGQQALGGFVPPGTYTLTLSRRVRRHDIDARRAADAGRAGRPGGHAHAGDDHLGARLSGARLPPAAHLHRRARAGQSAPHAHRGHAPRHRRLRRRRAAARHGGGLRPARRWRCCARCGATRRCGDSSRVRRRACRRA